MDVRKKESRPIEDSRSGNNLKKRETQGHCGKGARKDMSASKLSSYFFHSYLKLHIGGKILDHREIQQTQEP